MFAVFVTFRVNTFRYQRPYSRPLPRHLHCYKRRGNLYVPLPMSRTRSFQFLRKPLVMLGMHHLVTVHTR